MTTLIQLAARAGVSIDQALAQAEAALDRFLEGERRRFVQSLVEQGDATESDREWLMAWQREQAEQWRALTLEEIRAKLVPGAVRLIAERREGEPIH